MALVQKLSRWLSSGFGSGYACIVPGTFGSVAALVLWMMLQGWGELEGLYPRVYLAIATCVVGTIAIAFALGADEQTADPQWIVIDEWAGLFITLVPIVEPSWWSLFVAFGLFRFFDGLKWGPVALAERLPGALGIMADDVVAGLESAVVLVVLYSIGLL